jgi:hypothetical protein
MIRPVWSKPLARFTPPLAALITLVVYGASSATQTKQLSFEQVVREADLVVLATVSDKPLLAKMDASSGEVLRTSTVTVDQYLKGAGPPALKVLTLGGNFEKATPGGIQVQHLLYGGAPQLPSEGTRILLVLRSWSGDTYMLDSFTHAITPVEVSDGQSFVTILLETPELMTQATRVAYEKIRSGSLPESRVLIPERVPTNGLAELVQALLQRGRPAARVGQ